MRVNHRNLAVARYRILEFLYYLWLADISANLICFIRDEFAYNFLCSFLDLYDFVQAEIHKRISITPVAAPISEDHYYIAFLDTKHSFVTDSTSFDVVYYVEFLIIILLLCRLDTTGMPFE